MSPRHLDIYLNHPNIDFSDAESLQPHLKLALSEGETSVMEYPVRVAAFASVHSLSLFFVGVLFTNWWSGVSFPLLRVQNHQANPEYSASRVYFIGFRGDMRSVKRDATSMLHVPAPTAADAALGGTKAETKATNRTTAR